MSDAAPEATSRTKERLGRWSRYASWTAFDQFLELGFPNLILLPVLLALVGDHSYGIIVLGLACVKFVGVSPSNGLASFIMRDASHQDAAGQADLLRTVLVMLVALLIPLSAIFLGVSYWYANHIEQAELWTLLPFMAIYLVCLNLINTVNTMFRYRRTFRRMVGVHGLQAVLQLLAVPLYLAIGLIGIGIAFAFASLTALAYACWLERASIFGRPWYRGDFARGALKIWWPVAISSLLLLSAGSLDRLIVGAYWEPAAVAAFAAAAATARIMLIPGGQANMLLFSMLGKKQRSGQFSRKFYAGYLAAAAVLAAGVVGGGLLVGPWLVGVLYAKVAEPARALLIWTICAAGGMSMHVSLRPFVNKFLPPHYLPWMAGLSVVARLVPLALLVPTGGGLGAAQAMLIGSSVTALVWASVFVYNFILSGRDHSSRVTADMAPAD